MPSSVMFERSALRLLNTLFTAAIRPIHLAGFPSVSDAPARSFAARNGVTIVGVMAEPSTKRYLLGWG
jgi:hypothetical protein